ncbi:MAG: hypothetical protein L6R39_006197 [Caloplaca ligustica]|nr:MAG: hypothetical protein L6R39_006197 [Caloplaca ligustica]
MSTAPSSLPFLRAFHSPRYRCISCLPSAQYHRFGRNVWTAAKILNPEEPKPDDQSLKPLSRPIGVPYPPKPGENSGIDPRSWQEKRDDLFNYDKHLVRRSELTKQVAKPYFRDWSRTKHHQGKTFIAPSRIFRAEKSLYFPNMVGSTLASPKTPSDTTSVLRDRISIVSVYSGRWAEMQTQTFLNPQSNAALSNMIEQQPRLLQRVEINIEQDWMKALIIRTFMAGIRKQRREEDWKRYFLVTKGVTDEMKEAIGMGNVRVGYVYLVDWDCRIRWAGSANADEGEKEGLVAGAKRLVEASNREREEGKATGKKNTVSSARR